LHALEKKFVLTTYLVIEVQNILQLSQMPHRILTAIKSLTTLPAHKKSWKGFINHKIWIWGWVDPKAIVRLERLGQLKNQMTSSGIEPVTFWLVAWCLIQLPNPSSCTVALGSTQALTEMSTRNLPGSEEWQAHKADSLITICESVV
jgi:hypothetical protein